MESVGVMGASGYMGGEVLRVLLEHPAVEVAWATSRREAPIETFHPNLLGSGLRTIRPEDATACDVVFLALPTDAALAAAEPLLAAGSRVIDLGAAFRLDDRALWERTYGRPHPCWSLAEQAVYGVPELHGEAIERARLIANPGCFASAVILGLAPLLREDLIEPRHVVVDGLSGSAGIGAEPLRIAHHAELGSNLVPYTAVGHRHTAEMEQELGGLCGGRVSVHFTPVYVPIVRGILAIAHVFPRRPLDRSALLDLYRTAYADAPFVDVWDQPPEPDAPYQYRPYPWVSAVAGTNRCQIGLDVDLARGSVVVLTVLDSVGKGGAHVGVENMNLMLGMPRTAGLARRGCHP